MVLADEVVFTAPGVPRRMVGFRSLELERGSIGMEAVLQFSCRHRFDNMCDQLDGNDNRHPFTSSV